MKKTFNKYLPKIIGIQLNALHLVKPEKAIKKAFSLFSSPRKGRVLPQEALFLEQAKLEVIKAEKFSLQTYQWKNDGKTVLLVHGWESNTFRWKNLIEKLQKKGYNIIAFDAPGHGNSSGSYIHIPLYAKCVEAMVKRYAPDYVIGHSMGGMTTVYHQYQFPNPNIQKLVLLGPPSEIESIMSNYQTLLNYKPRVMKDLETYFIEKFGYKFKEFSIAKFAQSLKQPGLIIHDTFDRIAPVEASKSIHQNYKNSTFIETEGAGHSLNNDYIHTEVIKFLKN
jgi:pimeloyl-ACP methyl ester carboxylesterase